MKLKQYGVNDMFVNSFVTNFNKQNIGLKLEDAEATALNEGIKTRCDSLLENEINGTEGDTEIDLALQNELVEVICDRLNEIVLAYRNVKFYQDLENGKAHSQYSAHPYNGSIINDQIQYEPNVIKAQALLATTAATKIIDGVKNSLRTYTVGLKGGDY